MSARTILLVLLLAAFWALLYLTGLGAIDIDTSLEGFRVEVARQMLRTGDWIVPHLGDAPYFKKPPLCPWTIALASLPAGEVTPFSARLPSALAVFATALLVLGVGRRAFGRPAGVVGAFLFLVMPLVLEKGRRGEIEATLTLLVFASLAALVAGALETRHGRARAWTLSGWALLGLAMLDKGPPALLFVLPALAILFALRRGRGFRPLDHFLGLLLAAGLFVAWLVPLAAATGFAPVWDTFLHETVDRAVSEEIHNAAPLGFYLVVLPAGAAPALALLPWLVGAPRAARSRVLYLAAVVLVPLVLFSFFQGKNDRYLLPLYPAIALLGGLGGAVFAEDFRGEGRRASRVAATVGALAWILAGGVLGALLASRWHRPWPEAVLLGGVVSVLGAFGLWAVVRQRLGVALALLLLAAVPLQAAYLRVHVPARNATYSPRPLGEQVCALTPPDAPIHVSHWVPPQVLVYLDARVRTTNDYLSAFREMAPGEKAAFLVPRSYGAETLRRALKNHGQILEDRAIPWRGHDHRYLLAERTPETP